MAGEKELRALLAEARQELQVLASYVDDPATKWPNTGLKITAKAHKRAVQRIDAALAEPVVPCGDCDYPLTEVRPGKHQCDVCDDLRLHKEDRLRLRVENLRLGRERDEARAERDHFKAMLRERAEALLAAQEEIERLKLRFNA